MSRIFSLLCLAILMFGCGQDNQSQVAVQEQKRPARQPIVALVPMFDRAGSDLSWNIGDELTLMVREKLLQNNRIYLANAERVKHAIKKLNDAHDPFLFDATWVKQAFPKQEFVVFMELFEHDEFPLLSSNEDSFPKNSPAELKISLRVRALDIRGEQPKVALQEILQKTVSIPYQFTKVNFHRVAWDDPNFLTSPLGMVHLDLANELSDHLENYIFLARAS
jgi:hypothetical protein